MSEKGSHLWVQMLQLRSWTFYRCPHCRDYVFMTSPKGVRLLGGECR